MGQNWFYRGGWRPGGEDAQGQELDKNRMTTEQGGAPGVAERRATRVTFPLACKRITDG